jgi:glycosyltransferase involved in cell wall biosynthesis
MQNLTVCILSFNRPEYLRQALESVLNQTLQPKEIIIYDNGSDESVYRSVEDLLSKKIKWIGSKYNNGSTWNFNRAICNTKTKYIMLFHDDDRLHKNFLENQMSYFNLNDNLVALSSNGLVIDHLSKSSGELLINKKSESSVIFFQSSGEIAIQYASNSCIPLSPTIYITEVLKKITPNEAYGKVCDAVMMCELADIGQLGLNLTPLYDCRVHFDQDSKNFPFELMNMLEDFFTTCRFSYENQRDILNKLLLKQHAVRNMKEMWLSIKELNLCNLKRLFLDEKFLLSSAAIVVYEYILKILHSIVKKFL